MHFNEHLKGTIDYGDDPEVSAFDARLVNDEGKSLTMEKLADLLITYEGFKFEIIIHE